MLNIGSARVPNGTGLRDGKISNGEPGQEKSSDPKPKPIVRILGTFSKAFLIYVIMVMVRVGKLRLATRK